MIHKDTEKEFDEKFKKKPIFADFDKKPVDINDPTTEIAYCLTCDRFIIEEGCICSLADVKEMKDFFESHTTDNRILEKKIEGYNTALNNCKTCSKKTKELCADCKWFSYIISVIQSLLKNKII